MSSKTLAAWSLCLLVVLLATLFGRPDIPIDETRYISVAWEIWSKGDWLVMHLNGEIYQHKPPMLFWLINIGWHIFGVNNWWPHVIGVLFSLASLIVLTRIARRLWPEAEDIGTNAGWLLLSSLFWMFFSTAIMFDIMVTLSVLLALLGILQARDSDSRQGWLLCGLAMGFGFLAKGPAIIPFIIPVAVLGPWWGGRSAGGKRWYFGLAFALIISVAVGMLWFVPAAILGGPEYRDALLWRQTAGRISGSLAHAKPFWFYLAALPLLLFPVFFWRRAWQGCLAALGPGGGIGTRFLLTWIVPAFILFSVAGGKQLHYILPVVPAIALMIAAGWQRTRLTDPAPRIMIALPAICLLGGIALVLSPRWASHLWLAPYVGQSWIFSGAAMIVLAFGLALSSRKGLSARSIGVFSTGLAVVFTVGFLRPLAPIFDMTPIAKQLQRLESQGVPVAHASAYNDQYHFYGRLLRPLDEISRNQVGEWLRQHPDGRVIAYLKKPGDVAAVKPEFAQPYLDGAVVLVNAEAAARLPGHQ